MKKQKRIFIYIRVSTREQANEGYSIKEQESRLRAYAKARGYIIVKVYADPAYSGASLDRPAMQEMIKNIKNVDLVLVYKLDRLSRSQKDTLYLIEDVFLKNNVDFISMNESFDTSTPFGRAMVGILSVFAQLEREQIRERSMMGKEARAKAGLWHGGGGTDRVVTGYDYVDGLLIINDYEASAVRYMFELINKGMGTRRAFHQIKNKYPGVINSETTLRKIIRNPLYKGKIQHRKKIYEGEHEPIVTEEMFNDTQELLSKRTITSDPFRRNYLLSGLLYCGHCNSRMSGRTGGRLKDGTPMRYYRCYTSEGKHLHMATSDSCIKKSERKEPLEKIVVDKIKELDAKTINESNNKDDYTLDNIAALEKEVSYIDKKVHKLMELYSLDIMPIDTLTEKISKLNEDKKKIESHIEEEEDKLELRDLDEIKRTVSQLSTFDWDNEDTTEQRLVIAKLINKITLTNDDVTIQWAF